MEAIHRSRTFTLLAVCSADGSVDLSKRFGVAGWPEGRSGAAPEERAQSPAAAAVGAGAAGNTLAVGMCRKRAQTNAAISPSNARPYRPPAKLPVRSFAEALFRTAKYRPEFPLKGFADLDAARRWAMRFVQWYNHEHRHSGIRYVTPAQRHAGQDGLVLAARHAVYRTARAHHPRRWSGNTRNWTPVGVVALNPERDALAQARPQTQLSGSIGEPAFPSRPGIVQTTARNEGDGRSGATRSHAQRALSREHGEDAEHRTFSAVSTVAHSSSLGGSHLHIHKPPQHRLQQ
jgi:hypothetical protein